MNTRSVTRIVAKSCLVFLVAGNVFAGPISGPIDPTLPIDLPPTKPALPGLPSDDPVMIESQLGFMIQTPIIAFNNTGTLTYTVVDGLLAVDADPLAILFNNAGPPSLVFPGVGGYDVLINIVVAPDGSLVGGVPGDDLVIIGAVDLTGDFIPDVDGVLLTAEVSEYMGTDSGGSTDTHSYRFTVTGGFLAGPFGSDIAVELTSEQSDFTGDYTVDFSGEAKGDIGAVQCTGTIGDFVWLDLDGNGIQDDGEDGIPNVQVVLSDAAGNVIATQVTNSNGFYQFDGLCAGTYTVSVNPASLPPDVDVTLINAPGSNDTNDSNDPAGTTVTLPNNDSSDQDSDFGYVPVTSALGDYVWLDLNMDGIQDNNEPPLEGVMVNLYTCEGVFVGTTTTDNVGFYEFSNLPSGCYQVEFIAPPGLVFTLQDQNGDALDSDPDPTTGLTDPVFLGPGETNPDVDAGLFQPATAELGDRFWEDLNGNGVQDIGEPGIGGVTVNLFDCAGNLLDSTTTEPNGMYLFPDLAGGCYVVGFEPPADCILTLQDVGNNADDSDADPVSGLTDQITLADGQSDLTWDGGCYYTAGLGDYVWNDLNQNGIQDDGNTGLPGLLVVLLDGAMTPTGLTTMTGPDGEYEFTGLAPGSYFVQFTNPAGFVFTLPNVGADDTDSDANGTGKSDKVILASGEFDPTIDAGVFVPDDPSISIEKSTNGEDADMPTGPAITEGDPVLWEYVVSNTGNVALTNVIVTDDQGVAVDCSGQDTLAAAGQPGDSFSCTGEGIAVVGQYANIGSVVGTPPTGPTVSDSDPSHYLGVELTELCVIAAMSDPMWASFGGNHAFWLPGIDTDNEFLPVAGTFVENPADGTAVLAGRVANRSNSANGFDVVMNLTGATNIPPPGSPKKDLLPSAYIENGGPVDASTWNYYEDYDGTLVGFGDYAGSVITITPRVAAFQIGIGANQKNINFGASSWFDWTVTSQPDTGSFPATGVGDINVDINTECIPPDPGTCVPGDYADHFGNDSFSNNDGSLNWSTPWIEHDVAGTGPSTGNVMVWGGYLSLADSPDTGTHPSAAREADLSSFTGTTLSFDFDTSSFVDSDDTVILEISSDGGATYETLEIFMGRISGSRSYDISTYNSSSTRIRFRVSKLYGGDKEKFKVDNLRISGYCDTPPPQCADPGFVKDRFSANSFSNNDGSFDWSTPWMDEDVAGSGATAGNVQVWDGKMRLDDRPDTGTEPSAAREVDLTGYTSAIFSFDFWTTSHVDDTDAVTVEVSSDGGATYETLEVFTGISGASDGSRSYDISAYISSETRIRFRVSNLYGGDKEHYKVDNVRIDFDCD